MKVKILWIGDGGVATGFSRVSHSIIEYLDGDRFEVHHLAINYRGDPCPHPPHHFLYPAELIHGDVYGTSRVKPLIEYVKPDAIVVFNDPWVVTQYLQLIPTSIPVIAYTPVDAKPLQLQWVNSLSHIPALVAYTQFGASAYRDIDPKIGNLRIIPHGCDRLKFHPKDKLECRKELNIPPDVFVVFNGNRNQPRKRIDLTIKAFAKFAEDKPDARLYLHMGVEDQGWNVVDLMHRYCTAEKLILTSKNLSCLDPVDDETLATIYNACDVGVNTSLGEGFGLCSVEQALCGIPQLVPNHSACAELFSGFPLIDIAQSVTNVGILTEGGEISIDSLVSHLNTYYVDRTLASCHGLEQRQWFLLPQFSWGAIARQWEYLFDSVTSKHLCQI